MGKNNRLAEGANWVEEGEGDLRTGAHRQTR